MLLRRTFKVLSQGGRVLLLRGRKPATNWLKRRQNSKVGRNTTHARHRDAHYRQCFFVAVYTVMSGNTSFKICLCGNEVLPKDGVLCCCIWRRQELLPQWLSFIDVWHFCGCIFISPNCQNGGCSLSCTTLWWPDLCVFKASGVFCPWILQN